MNEFRNEMCDSVFRYGTAWDEVIDSHQVITLSNEAFNEIENKLPPSGRFMLGSLAEMAIPSLCLGLGVLRICLVKDGNVAKRT